MTLTVINNNYKTRIVTCAIIDGEILDTYQWIFDSILSKTGISPEVIFTNWKDLINQEYLSRYATLMYFSY
jgi:hypothetical protein